MAYMVSRSTAEPETHGRPEWHRIRLDDHAHPISLGNLVENHGKGHARTTTATEAPPAYHRAGCRHDHRAEEQ